MRIPLAVVAAATWLAGCQSPSTTLAEARLRLDATSQELHAADAVRATAVAEARDALGPAGPPDPSEPGCAVAAELSLHSPNVAVVNASVFESSPGPRLAAFETARVPLMAELLLIDRPSRSAAAALSERVDAATEPWSRDASLVIETRTRPRFTDEGAYHAGMIEGALVVWSYDSATVECAGRFAATNSPDVLEAVRADEASQAAFEADPVAWLEADLMDEAFDAAVARLHAVQ